MRLNAFNFNVNAINYVFHRTLKCYILLNTLRINTSFCNLSVLIL